ncbi:MAG TPA: SRPBCC family protein [Capillimicrobium sp.]|jgi:ribosome-associated toxin RatA of RatAB toxin-antitoxin module
MPGYERAHSAIVPAPRDEVWETFIDYEHSPEWQGSLKACRVLSRDEDGRGLEVEYRVDAKLREVRYVLRHSYEGRSTITGTYVEGDFRDAWGQWTFEDLGDGTTRASFTLRIDPGFPLPGRVQKMLNDRVMKSAVEDLARRFEHAPR